MKSSFATYLLQEVQDENIKYIEGQRIRHHLWIHNLEFVNADIPFFFAREVLLLFSHIIFANEFGCCYIFDLQKETIGWYYRTNDCFSCYLWFRVV
tara:strand:+ start:115 stop:402 length:288 start_codon:yes stop_codon:yes gene_type:complete